MIIFFLFVMLMAVISVFDWKTKSCPLWLACLAFLSGVSFIVNNHFENIGVQKTLSEGCTTESFPEKICGVVIVMIIVWLVGKILGNKLMALLDSIILVLILLMFPIEVWPVFFVSTGIGTLIIGVFYKNKTLFKNSLDSPFTIPFLPSLTLGLVVSGFFVFLKFYTL